MHIHSSQYNYILYCLLDMMLQRTRHEVILHGLWEVTSDPQVISHDLSVTSKALDGLKWQEMHNIHLLYNKTIVDLRFGRHGVLLNSKLYLIDLRSVSVNMTSAPRRSI